MYESDVRVNFVKEYPPLIRLLLTSIYSLRKMCKKIRTVIHGQTSGQSSLVLHLQQGQKADAQRLRGKIKIMLLLNILPTMFIPRI